MVTPRCRGEAPSRRLPLSLSGHAAGWAGWLVAADRFAVDELDEVHPAVVAAKGRGQLVAADRADAAGAVELCLHDAWRGTALGHHYALQLSVQVAAQLGADLRAREAQRPGVERAEAVVGVGDADQVGDRRPEEDVLDALGVAARAGREEGLGDGAAIADDHPARFVGGAVRPRVLARGPLVDLAAGVLVEVEAVAVDLAGQGVGACGDRLGPQRRHRPGGRRLVGDHALHVLVDRDGVDRVERARVAARRHHLQRPPVDGALDPDRARPRRSQTVAAVGQLPTAGASQADPAADPVGAVPAGWVEPDAAGAAGAAEADVAARDVDQHPDDPRGGERAEAGAPVVVAQDEAVALAVQGEAVGAVLAHADAVPEAAPVDDPGDAGLGGGRPQEAEAEGEDGEPESHLWNPTDSR